MRSETRTRSAGLVASLALALVSFSSPGAAETGRPPVRCTVKAPDTVVDAQVAALGQRFNAGPAVGAKLQVGGNVTDIVHIRNHTPCPIRLQKWDQVGLGYGSEVIDVPAGGSYRGHMWVPWRTNRTGGETVFLQINGQPYFRFWQMHRRVVFISEAELNRQNAMGLAHRNEMFERSPSVPGLATEGGPRALHVALSPTGEPFFKFEGVPE